MIRYSGQGSVQGTNQWQSPLLMFLVGKDIESDVERGVTNTKVNCILDCSGPVVAANCSDKSLEPRSMPMDVAKRRAAEAPQPGASAARSRFILESLILLCKASYMVASVSVFRS